MAKRQQPRVQKQTIKCPCTAKITEYINNERVIEWLKVCGMKIETESMETAIHDQALNTKFYEAHIPGINEDSNSRISQKSKA